MKKRFKVGIVILVLLAMVVTLIGCKGKGGGSATTKLKDSPEDMERRKEVAGSYEGTGDDNSTASLILEEDGNYEFYLSKMGLVESGVFNMGKDNEIVFIPEDGEKKNTKGELEGETAEIPFKVNDSSNPINFKKVDSVGDVYKEFLGDYVAKRVGNPDVIISILPDKKYTNSLSGETGTFVITNGEIFLTVDGSEDAPAKGKYNYNDKEMKVYMSVRPGIPKTELTFKKN